MKYSHFVALLSLLAFSSPMPHAQAAYAEMSIKTSTTKMAVRDLWVDHIFWVRGVVLANASKNSKAEKQAELSVVENAKKIASVLEPFYGKSANEKLFGLLAGHYGGVKEYMKSTFPKPNTESQKAANDKLIQNLKEISAFLSGANPNLSNDVLESILRAHVGHHIAQIKAVGVGDFSDEAATWDAMKQHMYTLSDALVDGIARQFPDRF